MTEYLLIECTGCKVVKEAAQFSPNASHKTGRQSRCKECCADARRMAYQLDADAREQGRIQNQVISAARRALVQRYPEDYRELLNAERLKRGLDRSQRSPN